MAPFRIHRRGRIALAAAGFLALLGAGIWWSRRPLDPLQTAMRYRDCLFAADAPCIRALTPSEEFADNPMSDDDIRAFLVNFVRPKYDGRWVQAEPDIGTDGSNGFQLFTWNLQTPRGNRALTLCVAKTDEGLRVVQGFSSMVIGAAGYDQDGLPTHGLAKLEAYRDNIRRWAPELEGYRLHRLQTTATGPPMTLAQFAAWTERRIRASRPQ